MKFAIFNQPVTVIYEKPALTKETEKGIYSTIADEGLYGMACRVLDIQGQWVHILTHYGYDGYVEEASLVYKTEDEMLARAVRHLAVVDARFVDVLTLPRVQGVCLASLAGGSILETLPGHCMEKGWTRVRLVDGREGYVRTQHLEKKRFEEDYLWMDPEMVLDNLKTVSARSKTSVGGRRGFSLQKILDAHFGGSEEAFRDNLVAEAMKYLGTQYRWGGKSHQGIDCSGLVSMAYMRSGVLIYRDAAIAEGYPIQKISTQEVITDTLKKGDALYFPGHIAMYIGDGKYIHSTGHIGSGGVVINSFRPSDPDFRQDLMECMYAAGGVRL